MTELLILETGAGKVTRIGLSGSRETPMGLFHFVGQVGSAIKAVEPSVSQDQTTKMLKSLGLMRGDDDPTTGQPMEVKLSKARVVCLTQNSRITATVTCFFAPSKG